MTTPLQILILEDPLVDPEPILQALRQAGFEPAWHCAGTEREYLHFLQSNLEVILFDHSISQIELSRALHLLKEHKLDIPLIVIAGRIGEEAAVFCLKQGATDFILKDQLFQLGEAVKQASKQQTLHQEVAINQAALRQEIEFSTTLINALPSFFVAIDRHGQPLMMNRVMLETLGYTAEEVVGLDYITTFVLEEDREKVSAAFKQLFETKQASTGQSRLLTKDGRTLLVEWYDQPVLKPNGELDYFFGIGIDITERTRTQHALRESEDRFRQVLSSISAHIYVTEVKWSGEKTNYYMTPNVESMTGYPAEVLKDDWSFWPSTIIHPEDRELAQVQATLLAKGQDSEVEYRLVRADGQIVWVRDSARVENTETGRLVFGLVTDITESKKTQEEIIRLYQAERDRYRESEALRQTILALVSTTDPDQLIERILAELQHVVSYDSASVQLLRDNHLKLLGGRGFPNPAELLGLLIPLHPGNPVMQALETLEPVIVEDVRMRYDVFTQEPYAAAQIRGWMGVPMRIGERVIGALTLDSHQPGFYTEAHARLASVYAAQAAIAIENARLYAEAERRTQQLIVLHELDRAIASSLRIDDLYRAFVEHIRQLLTYDFISIILLEEDNFRVAYTSDLDESIWRPNLLLKNSAVGWVIQQNQPLLRQPIGDELDFAEDEGLVALGIQSTLSIPLRVKRQVIGTWNIASRQESAYIPDDLEIAQSMADQLALAIENARLFQQAQQEIKERKQAQAALENERASLAQRVEQRTAELSMANAQLARAARLKDEFLASMSHELRTPLNAILGMSEALQEQVYGSINSEQSECIREIEESGRHLLELINDILDLSKIEAGKAELLVSSVSVQSVCEASLRLVKQAAHKKQLKIFSELDEQVIALKADERRLKQMLVNLLSNAVKFTPPGGQVGLEVKSDAHQEAVHFIVWDTGIGIAQEDMKRLFRPFIQLDSRLSRQYPGTGLGLVLVYRLTRLHGGSVSVQSEPGRGSQFTISLPWRKVTGEEVAIYSPPYLEETSIRPQSLLPSSEANLSPLLLLAEDNEANINTLSRYLVAKGYRLAIARDGQEAIERAKELRPNAILMDIQMPGIDGLEAIRRLRQETSLETTIIIALTALAMPGDRERCLSEGANEYLSKPVSLKELVQLLEAQLIERSVAER
jgi:PAS domain S-box-containing protein